MHVVISVFAPIVVVIDEEYVDLGHADVGHVDGGTIDAFKNWMEPTRKKLSDWVVKHVNALVPGSGSSDGEVTAKMDGAEVQDDPEAKADFRQVAEVMCVSLSNVYVYITCIYRNYPFFVH